MTSYPHSLAVMRGDVTPTDGEAQRLRDALAPFAKFSEHMGNERRDDEVFIRADFLPVKPGLTYGDFRRAAAALK